MTEREGARLLVSGRMTIDSIATLLKIGLQPADKTGLVIDLARVEGVDSAAVSLLLIWLRQSRRSGLDLCFANIPENLSSLIRLYGVMDMLPLCRD